MSAPDPINNMRSTSGDDPASTMVTLLGFENEVIVTGAWPSPVPPVIERVVSSGAMEVYAIVGSAVTVDYEMVTTKRCPMGSVKVSAALYRRTR